MTGALGALAAVALLAGGCATQGAVSDLGSEVSKLRSELGELRVAQEVTGRDLARVGPQMEALDVRTSETQAAVRTMSAEFQRFHQRFDVVDTAVGETRARVETLTQAPAPPARPTAAPPPSPTTSSPIAVERPRVHAAPSPSAPPAQAAAPVPLVPQAAPPESVPPGAVPLTQPAPAAPAGTRAGNPEQEYNAALATFRSREHGQAVLDFIDFIAKHPKHPLAGNAQYWIGEAYWTQRDYRQALVEFEKVSEYGPGKAPDALVKIGLCHARLRDASRAEQAWQRVISEYPKSEAAGQAQSLLRTNAGSLR